jgi:hypothetical protein
MFKKGGFAGLSMTGDRNIFYFVGGMTHGGSFRASQTGPNIIMTRYAGYCQGKNKGMKKIPEWLVTAEDNQGKILVIPQTRCFLFPKPVNQGAAGAFCLVFGFREAVFYQRERQRRKPPALPFPDDPGGQTGGGGKRKLEVIFEWFNDKRLGDSWHDTSLN